MLVSVMTVLRARVAGSDEYPLLENDVLAVRIRVRRRPSANRGEEEPQGTSALIYCLSLPNVANVLSNDIRIRQRDPSI